MTAGRRTRYLSHATLASILVLASSARAGDVSVQLDSGTGFSVKNAAGAIERLRVDEATGNVSRNGALFVHTTGSNSLYVGPGAGNLTTSGIGGNVALGHASLASNTTGAFNSAVGHLALSYNTTGHSNAAFGRTALMSNTTGYSNSAFGVGALYANSGGTDNAAFGGNALRLNTVGTGNTAVGGGALRANTTGYRNAALGGRTLRSNTTGSENVAAGWSALYFTTSGARNAAFGSYALRNNATGFENAAHGTSALRANTSGERNTAVGPSALVQNTSGSRNVAVGFNAGSSHTTGSDNVYIANVGADGESGRIRIGTNLTHTRASIAGVHGAVVTNFGVGVLVEPDGTLGTVVSSGRFKEDVRDMGDASEMLMKLRPVTFHYREDVAGAENAKATEYGLIAEEVAEVAPELVAPGADGKPYSVRYHVLPSLLLNEVKEQHRVNEEQRQLIASLSARLEAVEAAPASCEAAAR